MKRRFSAIASAGLERILAFASRGNQRTRLIGVVVLVLGIAFLTVAVLSYIVSRERMRDLIVSKELPLTSDLVYAEIQRDFARPLEASTMMASDTFLRDWTIAGEKDPAAVERFLGEMQKVNAAFTAYFVSEATHAYYTPSGVLKSVSRGDPHDQWFFDLEHSDRPYVVEVDTDQTHDNALTVFINYRVFDDQKRFLGIAGLGLNVNAVRRSLERYQHQFDLAVYFVDRSGKVMMAGGERDLFEDIASVPGLSALAPKILGGREGSLDYVENGETHLLNVLYMPELNWYLLVERVEDVAVSNIRRVLYINLLIAALATALVATVLGAVMSRFNLALDKAMASDSLTDLTNRRTFNILFRQAAKARRKGGLRLSAVVFNIDGLKRINANFGHGAGDQAIKAVASAIESHARPNDILCRWAGQEFLLLLHDCGLDRAMALAEGIRREVEHLKLSVAGQAVSVTVTAGAAEMSADEGQESVLARVEQGLQAAKRAGGNNVISSGRF